MSMNRTEVVCGSCQSVQHRIEWHKSLKRRRRRQSAKHYHKSNAANFGDFQFACELEYSWLFFECVDLGLQRSLERTLQLVIALADIGDAPTP